MVSGGCNNDAIKRCSFGPAKVAIPYTHLDIFVAQIGQSLAGKDAQGLNDIDSTKYGCEMVCP